MVTRIDIKNFKLFWKEEQFINLKPLTIVTGANGKGKSTFLQSMTVIAQSIRPNGDIMDLNLNGRYAMLGNFSDAKNVNSSVNDEISFTFYQNSDKLTFIAKSTDEDIKSSAIHLAAIQNGNSNMLESLQNLSFVSAERIGPKFSYQASNNTSEVGTEGEFTACAIYNNQFMKIKPELIEYLPNIFPEVNIDKLDISFLGILNFWMSKMFGEISVDSAYITEVNQYVLKFKTAETGNALKPLNVGYGFSYALPILAAGLLSKKDSILILENPEAHLHPKAQSLLGKFLAWITKGGAQVFVETHSEHIFNAPRVLVVQEALDNKDIAVLYFGKRESANHENIEILKDGRVDHWPDGFFDQMEKDNEIILQL